jgi:hypothetical protein
MKQMGARNAGNPHVACDVEGAGDVERSRYLGRPARQSSTLLTTWSLSKVIWAFGLWQALGGVGDEAQSAPIIIEGRPGSRAAGRGPATVLVVVK